MNKNIVIINYNTQEFVDKLVLSINKFVCDARIFVFDNSDKEPFVNTFDNVNVIDNTNGQIIDFNKFLSKYPNRNISGGRLNNWASAKHCYSVEKCIELFDESFLLVDSDVLIKKDISELFDESYIYVAEEIRQDNGIKRASPFLCFINVKMCKDNNIHYFDENYMHGLWFKKNSDIYDTGAAFLINSSKFEHKNIRCSDYIVHYGHGSWKKSGYKYELTSEQFFNENKYCWSNNEERIAIYTCITGKYETPTDSFEHRPGYDYFLFSDDVIKTNSWDLIVVNFDGFDNSGSAKKQRYIKTHPNEILKDYDITVWIDANTDIDDRLYKYIEENKKNPITFKKHPNRDCIYDEIIEVVKCGKENIEMGKFLFSVYEKEGFPKHYGLYETNIIVSHPKNKEVQLLYELWWNEIFLRSHRDQLSLNYVIWKNDLSKIIHSTVSNDFKPKFHRYGRQ